MQLLERPIKLASEAQFKAIEVVEFARFVDETPEGKGDENAGAFFGMEELLAGGFLVQRLGFERDYAEHSFERAAGGFDRHSRVRIVRLQIGFEFGAKQGTELWIDRQFYEPGGFRVTTMPKAVGGGFLLPGSGDWSSGAGAIEAGGLALAFGSHDRGRRFCRRFIAGFIMHDGTKGFVWLGR